MPLCSDENQGQHPQAKGREAKGQRQTVVPARSAGTKSPKGRKELGRVDKVVEEIDGRGGKREPPHQKRHDQRNQRPPQRRHQRRVGATLAVARPVAVRSPPAIDPQHPGHQQHKSPNRQTRLA